MKADVENSRDAAHYHQPDSNHIITTTSASNEQQWRRPLTPSDLRRRSSDEPESSKQRRSKLYRSSSPRTALRIVLLSDTHELHREVDVPDGDILIHAGDVTMFSRSLRSIVDFNRWLGELTHTYKIVVGGNHDTLLHTDHANCSLIDNAIVLINEDVEIAGLKIWGSPVTPVGPAFCLRSVEERRRLYAKIPVDTDILITHGPAFGILDRAPGSGVHAGDQVLLDAVNRVKPRLHVFGHVHSGFGLLATENTLFVNAALLGPNGDINKKPIVLRMVRQ